MVWLFLSNFFIEKLMIRYNNNCIEFFLQYTLYIKMFCSKISDVYVPAVNNCTQGTDAEENGSIFEADSKVMKNNSKKSFETNDWNKSGW